MRPFNLSLVGIYLVLTGCTTTTISAPSEKPLYPTLETIEVEGYVIYYRDLSDPCDPASTAWNNLRQQTQKETASGNCSNTTTHILNSAPEFVMPDHDYLLLFALRGKNLSSTENDAIMAQLAAMRAWPVRYQVYGAAGGEGPTLEKLGMKRAGVVKQGLLAVGIPETKIEIMPYDPSIPGLRAIVRLSEEGA